MYLIYFYIIHCHSEHLSSFFFLWSLFITSLSNYMFKLAHQPPAWHEVFNLNHHIRLGHQRQQMHSLHLPCLPACLCTPSVHITRQAPTLRIFILMVSVEILEIFFKIAGSNPGDMLWLKQIGCVFLCCIL